MTKITAQAAAGEADHLRFARRLVREIQLAPADQRSELFTELARIAKSAAEGGSPASEKNEVMQILLKALDEHRIIEGIVARNAYESSWRPEDRQEISQDVRAKVSLRLSSWSGEKPLTGWMNTIARNTVYDRKRESDRRPRLVFESTPTEPTPVSGSHSSLAANRDWIKLVLSEFSSSDRELIQLKIVECHSVRYTAEQLNRSQDQVRHDLDKIKRSLNDLRRKHGFG